MIAPMLMVAGALGYGGPLIAFSLLLLFRARIPWVQTEDLVRVYRTWGAGSGVSLGLLTYAAVWHYAVTVNPGADFPASHALRWDTELDVLRSVQVLLYGAGWISYTALEVWTLEPCRKLDQGGLVTDRDAYEAAARTVRSHLTFNAVLFLAVALLATQTDLP